MFSPGNKGILIRIILDLIEDIIWVIHSCALL